MLEIKTEDVELLQNVCGSLAHKIIDVAFKLPTKNTETYRENFVKLILEAEGLEVTQSE